MHLFTNCCLNHAVENLVSVSVIQINKLLIIYVLVNWPWYNTMWWLTGLKASTSNCLSVRHQWKTIYLYFSLIPTIALILCSLSTDICQLQCHDWDKQATFFSGMFSSGFPETVSRWLTRIGYTDWPVVELIYLVFTRMPGESHRRRFSSLLFCACDVLRAVIISLCWFCPRRHD